MIKRALLSVSDKIGLDRVVEELVKREVELISSGGTADQIRKMGHRVLDVSDYTGTSEMPGGLIKTLHPKIHGGILGNLRIDEQRTYMNQYKIEEIDLVVVNFYPFEEEMQNHKLDLQEAANHIDIGGPALARAAAKAAILHGRVTVLTSPTQYDSFLEEVRRNEGDTTPTFKLRSAVQAFASTYAYDKVITKYLDKAIKNGV